MKTLLYRVALPAFFTLPILAIAQPPAGGRQGPPPPPEVLIVELFKGYDANADGKLSTEELAVGLKALIPPPPDHPPGNPPAGATPPKGGERGPAGAAAEMMRLGDSNKDLQLDRAELTKALELFHDAHPPGGPGRGPRPQPGSQNSQPVAP